MHESVLPIFYLVAMWQYNTKSEYESLLPLIHSSGGAKEKIWNFLKSQKFWSASWTKQYSDALLTKPFCWLSQTACNQEFWAKSLKSSGKNCTSQF